MKECIGIGRTNFRDNRGTRNWQIYAVLWDSTGHLEDARKGTKWMPEKEKERERENAGMVLLSIPQACVPTLPLSEDVFCTAGLLLK
jgi:hypothetical protein